MRPFHRLSGSLLLAALGGCQLFASSSVGLGIGQPCKSDDECHDGVCSKSACAVRCSASEPCPAPSQCEADGLCRLKPLGAQCTSGDECQGGTCYSSLCTSTCTSPTDCEAPATCGSAGVCELPLKVAFIYVGVPQDEGWTLTHEQGRQYAMDKLSYLQSDYVQNTFLPDDAKKATDKFVDDGFDVVVATSFSLRNPMNEKANQYLDKKFLTCSSNVTGTNIGSYFGRMEQAYYLAGYAAGFKTKSKRLGFVGSYVTPEVVRHINAFTLGAIASGGSSIVVEVRWVGFWFDTNPPDPVTNKYAETRLTDELVETGCDVIAHNMDNGRSIAAVEEAHKGGKDVYSLGNDNQDACSKGPTSCLGAAYWNWGPLYQRLFDDIHKGTWDPKVIVNDNIGVNPETSIPNFAVNDSVAGSDISIAVNQKLSELAKPDGVGKAFVGPYCSTGQRMPTSCVNAGETLSDDELHTMCWFVEGVVEKTDPMDPTSADEPALVPPECQTQQ